MKQVTSAESRTKEQNDALILKLYPNGRETGRVLFTGPDGVRDHRVNVLEPARYIGIGVMSPEGTSELSYLWRAAVTTKHPLSKMKNVGEIGWNVEGGSDIRDLKKRKPLLTGEFRQLSEDRHSHLYQNPWIPHPDSDEYKIDRLGREFIYRPHNRYVLSSTHRCGCLANIDRPTTSFKSER